MLHRTLCAVGAGSLFLLCVGVPVESSPPAGPDGAVVVNTTVSRRNFALANPNARVATSSGRITQVYGRAFSHGRTAAESAESFRVDRSAMFGVPAADLVAISPVPGGEHIQPIMYDRVTGTFKFTGFFYTQQRQGVPVFRSALKLLVRNLPDNPLVLASVDLHDLGGFQVDEQVIAAPTANASPSRRVSPDQ